jgi:hypothetical protein
MKKLLCALCAVLISAGAAWAANTTLVGSSLTTIEITGLDADWSWATDIVAAGTFNSKINTAKIRSIKFYPSGANDRMIVRDGGLDAATFFDSGLVSAASDPRVEYYTDNPRHVDLVIDISDCTIGIAANAKVVIQIEPEK